MVAIVNTGGDPLGMSNYEVRVTVDHDGHYEVIARFRHSRPDGMTKCLQRAAQAVERAKWMKAEKLLRMMEEKGGPHENVKKS